MSCKNLAGDLLVNPPRPPVDIWSAPSEPPLETRSETMSREKVAIIGSGLVGKSWAMIFAAAGYEVSMYDSDPDQLAKGPSINDVTH